MKLANIRQLKNNPSQVVKAARRDNVIITYRGKPLALLRALSEEELEDFVLLHADEFRELTRQADAEFKAYIRGEPVKLKTLKQLLKEARRTVATR